MGYYVDDPNGGPSQYHEGFDPAQGQSETGPGVHTSKKRLLWEQGRNFLVPAGVMGADALLGAVVNAGTTAGAGAAPSAVAGGASAGGVGAGTAGLGASAAAPALGVPVGSTLVPGSVAATTAAGLSAAPAAASIAAPAAAATAGGGLLSKLTPTLLGDVSKGLQGYAASQTNNRDADIANQYDYDRLNLQRNQQENANILTDLQQRKFLSDENQRSMGNAVHGGYLSGVQDVNITPPPGINMVNITGGLRPSAISGKDEMGKTIQSQAMYNLLNPQQLPTNPTVPGVTPPKGAGAAETGTGIAAAILPWLSPFLRPNTTPVSTAPANSQVYTPPKGALMNGVRF